jgi:hypothetical protein
MASTSRAIIGWCAGILATVISSVLIYYFTRPVPPPPVVSSIQIEGRVIDIAKKTLIPNARVSLRAGAISRFQVTDTLGRYGFDISGLPETTEASFAIEAPGYPPYSVNATLAKLRDSEDNELLPPSVDHSSGSPSTPPSPPTGLTAGTPAGPPAKTPEGPGRDATLGAVVAKNPGLRGAVAVTPAPAGTTPKQIVQLPAYVRRTDFVKIAQPK